MSEKYSNPRRRRRKKSSRSGKLLVGILAVVLVVLCGVAFWISGLQPEPNLEGSSSQQSSAPSTSTEQTEPSTTTTVSTAPPVVKVSTATILNTGDILMHNPILNGNLDHATGTYDFSRCFRFVTDHVSAVDLAVANLEVTLAGNENGYGYTGYPTFNCPDIIAQNLKDTGFDLLLTANNHSYDTRSVGFHRTQQVLQGIGMDYLGTVPSVEVPLWQIKDINGIQIGMMCYTYETENSYTDRISLNGIVLSPEDSPLIGSFSYSRLGEFCTEVQQNIEAMKAAGAEAIMMYIHWGDEYYNTQNSYQNAIAQDLCDLGVDVIVGGHPHVIQPMELLTSNTDPDHKTVCLYSMGNAISNQRVEYMEGWPSTEHSEDGVFFYVSFAKYSDGTVILESADIIPLWVNHYLRVPELGQFMHEILPLDTQIEDWKTQFGLDDEQYQETLESYQRTMDIVGEGLVQIQQYLQQLVADTEAALGVTE